MCRTRGGQSVVNISRKSGNIEQEERKRSQSVSKKVREKWPLEPCWSGKSDMLEATKGEREREEGELKIIAQGCQCYWSSEREQEGRGHDGRHKCQNPIKVKVK